MRDMITETNIGAPKNIPIISARSGLGIDRVTIEESKTPPKANVEDVQNKTVRNIPACNREESMVMV